MAVKYFINYKDDTDTLWRAEISTPTFTGTVVQVRTVAESNSLAYEGETDNPFSVFITSTYSFTIYNDSQVDINELQLAADKDIYVALYKNGTLFWDGYMVPDGIEKTMASTPYKVNLKAICGLALLEKMDYTHNNLLGTGDEANRCLLNYVRQILFATQNLGLPAPVRWSNKLECTDYPGEDIMTGSVRWSPFGEGFASYQAGQYGTDPGPVKTCDYILRGILQCMQCRIYKSDGRWIIRRIPELVSGLTGYKETPGTLGKITIQTGNQNLLKQIGRSGYRFINEDQLVTVIKGIKSAKVTYNADVRDNILPNGNQDLLSLGQPLYWGSYELLLVESTHSLDGRDGTATKLTLDSGELNNSKYTLVSPGGSDYTKGLPIDTLTQVKIINFGFTFSPHLGFPVDENGIIQWGGEFGGGYFYIQVIFNAGSTRYFLNEYGFWTTEETYIHIVVDNMMLDDVATINFDKFQGIIMPTPDAQPIAGDTSDIKVIFVVQPGMQYTVDNIYINIQKANDVYESSLGESKNTDTDEVELNISSSFGGYELSNFMSSYFKNSEECFFKDALAYTGTLTGLMANTLMRYRYKPSRVYNGSMQVNFGDWSYDQLYLIDSFGTTRFLPLNATFNIEKSQVLLVAIECRNDFLTFTEKYYSSNDNQLSN